jgi:enamine deaminase RidA (YjgF/YER057c/UK114 family)
MRDDPAPPFKAYGDASKIFGAPDLPFTPAIRVPVARELVFVSGCLGVPDGEDASPLLEAEVRRAFQYLDRILRISGGRLEDVVSLTKFLTNLERDNAFVTLVMRELFPVMPTSTTVEVSRLVPDNIHFEVNAIAAVPVRADGAITDQSGGSHGQ